MSDTSDVAPPDMTIDSMIGIVPWPRLTHAYDVALDAPGRLRALVDGVTSSSETDESFDDWMLGTVVHQGTPYSATPAILWIARRILTSRPSDPAVASCLAAVGECATTLRWVADQEPEVSKSPAVERNRIGEPPWATYLPLGREVPPKQDGSVHDDYFLASRSDAATLAAAIQDWEGTVNECVREGQFLDEAICAATAMVLLGPSAALLSTLRSVLDSDNAPSHRGAAAFALSAAGVDVNRMIGHEERAIRLAAALGSPDHAGSLAILVSAVRDRAWLRATYPRGFAGPEPWLTAALVQVVLNRVQPDTADDELVEGLEYLLSTETFGPLGATYEWGPILGWLFPSQFQPQSYRHSFASADLTPLQRRLIAALVRNPDPWERGQGNASLALGRVGLPHDRATVGGMVGAMPRGRWWRRSPRS